MLTANEVAFGVLALLTLPRLTAQFESISGIYIPLAVLAAIIYFTNQG